MPQKQTNVVGTGQLTSAALSVCNLCVCHTHGRSEREEEFYQMSVDVKGQGSLEKSLENYVAGEGEGGGQGSRLWPSILI